MLKVMPKITFDGTTTNISDRLLMRYTYIYTCIQAKAIYTNALCMGTSERKAVPNKV